MIQHESEQRATMADKVTNFLGNNKSILWILLLVILTSIVLFTIVDKSKTKKSINNSELSVEVQELFQEWTIASEEDKKAKEDNFLTLVGSTIESGVNNIATEKALYTRGQYYLQKEEWNNAFLDFNKVVEIAPHSYLSPVSLYNAANALENDGKIEETLSLLEKLVLDYDGVTPLIPETLINLGRLYESFQRNEEALKTYEKLVEFHSSSNWTNLAKTRIISLKASGASE